MNMIATYMASATRDEYDDIARTIRHDLVFSEYGEDIENFIQYIPNTAETCRTCMESYPAQAVLVCTNTGQFYSLDLYDIEENPNNSNQGGSIIRPYRLAITVWILNTRTEITRLTLTILATKKLLLQETKLSRNGAFYFFFRRKFNGVFLSVTYCALPGASPLPLRSAQSQRPLDVVRPVDSR